MVATLGGLINAADIDWLAARLRVGSRGAAYDLNDDNLIDTEDHRAWVHTVKQVYSGDANLDGDFDSRDLVDVFAAGKFETLQKAGWAEGDWNGDGVFGSGDLVAAFQEGGYEQGPRPRGPAVPEPPAALLILFATAMMVLMNPQKHR